MNYDKLIGYFLFSLLFVNLFFSVFSDADIIIVDSGSFDTEVDVQTAYVPNPSETMVSVSSGSFDIKVYIEYINWSEWSDWWIIDYVSKGNSITSPSPSNNSENVSYALSSLSVSIENIDGNTFNWSIESSPDIGSNSSTGDINGTKDVSVSGNLSYGTSYVWFVNVSDTADQVSNETYYFSVESLSNVSNFSASRFNGSIINLTWSKDSNISNSIIRFKTGSAPTSLSDGTLLENTTNISYNHTGLQPGTHYYYSIWGYNSTSNTFSSGYVSSDNYTNPGSPSDVISSSESVDSIILQWTKGTNTTHTYIRYNETAYPTSVTDGTYGNNVTTSYAVISGLSSNTKYYFSLWGYNSTSNLYSEYYATYIGWTSFIPSPPTDFEVYSYNDTQLNLSWTKGSGTYTIIQRKTGGYPTNYSDGTTVYSSTGNSYEDKGLSTSVKYYYRAWSKVGTTYSDENASASNYTRPQTPYGVTARVNNTNLDITWTNGNGTDTVVVVKKTGSYPTSVTDGTILQNSSATSYTVSNVNNSDYFSLFAYNNTSNMYSIKYNVVWGLLEIFVYKEDEPWIAIGNYTVFVLNPTTEEVYQATMQNNPTRIDVSDVPNGEDITIKISKQGYKTHTQVMDILENGKYSINFYLPASSEGSPPSEEGEPWYVNTSDTTNETFATNYIIFVVEEGGADIPIQDAYVQIKRYINETANESNYDEFDTILSGYTDAGGKLGVSLISESNYIIAINKSGFQTYVNTFSPLEIAYGLYDELYLKFVLQYEEEETPTYILPEITTIRSGTTIYVNYTDEMNATTDVNTSFYYFNETGSLIYISSVLNLSENTIHIQLNDTNTSLAYKVVVFYNQTYFGANVFSKIIDVEHTGVTTPSSLNIILVAILGDAGAFLWTNLILWLAFVVMMFSADKKHAGKYLIIIGGIMAFVALVGFHSAFAASIPVLFVLVGVIVEWINARRN